MSDHNEEKLIEAARNFHLGSERDDAPMPEGDELYRVLEHVAALVDGTLDGDALDESLTEVCKYPQMLDLLSDMTIARETSSTSEAPPPAVVPFPQRRRLVLRVGLSLATAALLALGFFSLWQRLGTNSGPPGENNVAELDPDSVTALAGALSGAEGVPRDVNMGQKPSTTPRLGEYDGTLSSGNRAALQTAGSGGPTIYERVAPSVVVLTSMNSLGTGFVFREGGWIVTNHHVAQIALFDQQGRSYLDATVGEIGDLGVVHPIGEKVRVYVYKTEQVRDLAILRPDPADPAAAALLQVPALTINAEGIRPDSEVRLVGHASSGTLWSIKRGHVSGIDVFRNLSAIWQLKGNASENQILNINDMGETLLIESDVVSRPGDSGGPLVNSDGEVVGICFGSYDFDGKGGRNFFVHAREIQTFLADIPSTPLVTDPYHWTVYYNDSDAVSWTMSLEEAGGRSYLFLLGKDKDGDGCFLGFGLAQDSDLETVTRIVDAGGVTQEAANIGSELANALRMEFVWSSTYTQSFQAAYAESGQGALSVVYLDDTYDGQADLVVRQTPTEFLSISTISGPILREVQQTPHSEAYAVAYTYLKPLTEALVRASKNSTGGTVVN